MKTFLFLISLSFLSVTSYAEDKSGNDGSIANPIKDHINYHLDPSWFTIGQGIDFDRLKRKFAIFDKQIYEGQINGHFNSFQESDGKGWDFLSKISAKLQVRQFTEDSAPVKTPGYLPRISVFFWNNEDNPKDKPTYYLFRLSHHSNGQSGAFYEADGTINTNSGSFSTNYFELAGHNLPGIRKFSPWTKVYFIWHPGFNREINLEDQYEEMKIGFECRSRDYLPNGEKGARIRYHFGLSYTLAGRKFVRAPVNQTIAGNAGITNNPQDADLWDNFQLETRILFNLPNMMEDFDLFIKYDLGYDYYNINFWRRMNAIQFGLIGNPFG